MSDHGSVLLASFAQTLEKAAEPNLFGSQAAVVHSKLTPNTPKASTDYNPSKWGQANLGKVPPTGNESAGGAIRPPPAAPAPAISKPNTSYSAADQLRSDKNMTAINNPSAATGGTVLSSENNINSGVGGLASNLYGVHKAQQAGAPAPVIGLGMAFKNSGKDAYIQDSNWDYLPGAHAIRVASGNATAVFNAKKQLEDLKALGHDPNRDVVTGADMAGLEASSGKPLMQNLGGAWDARKDPAGAKLKAMQTFKDNPEAMKRLHALSDRQQANPEQFKKEMATAGKPINMGIDAFNWVKNNWGKILGGLGGAAGLYMLYQIMSNGQQVNQQQPQGQPQQASFGPSQYSPWAYKTTAGPI